MKTRAELKQMKCCVIKIGSAVLTDNGRGLNINAIDHWVAQISTLKSRGIDVIVVSSGSVAEGLVRLGWNERPRALHELQAAASVGQMGLIQAYEQSFQKQGFKTAQILLTHDDLADRTRYLNAQATVKTLLALSVVPIVNENDVVANEELKVGDNDTLAAMIANLVCADVLMILTDQAGLYERDPRLDSSAELIKQMAVNDARLDVAAGESTGALGRGGMQTKLQAARIAARSGAVTLILPGLNESVILDAVAGEQVGSFLMTDESTVSARKRWLSGQLSVKGKLHIDVGAEKKLLQAGASLLAVGVVSVSGQFERGDLVSCVDDKGLEVACGLVNYSSDSLRLIQQKKSSEIEGLLGFIEEPEVIHRDNLVLS